MGKAKKGRRADKDDFDSDAEVDNIVNDEPVKSKKSKDKKKGDDVEDLAEDLKDLKVEKSKKKDKKSKKKGGDSDDEDISVKGKIDSGSESDAPKSKQKNRKNQSGKKGFAALSIESDGEESEDGKPKSKAKLKKGKKDVDVNDEEEEVKPSKSKNKKKNKKQVDSDDELSENDVPKPKAKGKKGKKAADSDDDMSDNEVPKPKVKGKKGKKAADSDDDMSDNEVPKPKAKGKKGKKAADSDDEMNIEISKPKAKTKDKKGKKAAESDDEFDFAPTKTVKTVTTSKAPKASFAMLMADDQDDDDDDQVPSPPPSDDESEKTESRDHSKSSKPKKPQPQESQKESKKGKKAKKKRNDDDEDIDKVLAELEMEYSGQAPVKQEPKPTEEAEEAEKKEKKGKEPKKEKEPADEAAEGENEEGGTVKTAAQKKKEKKEREKQKKLAQKKAEATKKTEAPKSDEKPSEEKPAEEKPAEPEKKEEVEEQKDDEKEEDDDLKKKKKKGVVKEEPKKKGKGPDKRTILAMQEALKKQKEEEERLKREEEERLRLEEEMERLRLEQLRKEQEKKEKKKLKEKQRKEKLKAEGKLLSSKQKQANARSQATLEALKAQGFVVPDTAEKKPRPGTRIKPSKLKQQTSKEEKEENKSEEVKTDQVQVEIIDKKDEKPEEKKEEEDDGVKDAWDAESSEEEPEEDKSDAATQEQEAAVKGSKTGTKESTPENEESSSAEGSGSDSESSDSGSDDESEEESDGGKRPDAERKKATVSERIQNRKVEAEKKRTIENLRAAVVCVLGHVDTGKTKILDKLRRTNVQDGEAGGITQQIGATNVPIDAIQDSTRHVKGFADKKFKIPGLLIIDTPGHESFSNLRNRGSSLCDIAILVVDIMHGLEPQTLESINLLKTKKCPFVVALNKIDRLYDWQTMNRKDVQDIIKGQAFNTQREFEKRAKEVIVQFAEQGLNAALFYENPDPRSYVSLVPTSAITGEGMGNLLALIVDACQGPLAKRLMFSEELQATVLEVKALPGLGTTIDCILVNGTLREGDTMIVAGTDGPIVTQIRSLLMPQPMKELRVKNAYIEYREIKAAQGVKIAAKELEKAIAGLNLLVAQKPDEVEILKEEIAKELSHALSKIKLAERGVYVQASTLGALEALLDFLKSSEIPYAGIRIGPVVKKDVMKASIMLEHDIQYATILAFDVKVERDAQELADSLGVRIFTANIIYHLFDDFIKYKDELKQRKREEFKHVAVFPCKLKVLPHFIFKSRDPIVIGVMVENGIVKEGTPICVPSKEFVDLGIVTSIEFNHKTVESARKGQEVCIKIEPIPGESPKMYGRHFDEKDMLISKISRQSIDACKDYFREDLIKPDWQLMVELKKLFQIL